MADIEPIGKALVIPNEVLSSLDKVDEKINKIAADSSKMADSFTSAMKRMSGNTDGLLSKLSAINQIISRIGGANLSTGITGLANGMSTTSTEAEKAASSITKAAVALNKFKNESSNSSEQQSYENILKVNQRMLALIEKKEQVVKKATEREARAVEAAEQRKIRAQQRAYKEQAKLYREQNLKANTTVSGALGFADTANTYARRAQAIKYLEAAIKKLSTTDANYQANLSKLVTAHKRLTAEQDKVAQSLGKIQRSQHNLMNTSEQLARKFALIFSVSQIVGYVKSLVQVRGEFELQNKALESILQNKDKADKLFSQITQLAVQSPFTLKELVTYTKSLSAYQVEYEKLYDTTKMLADVSAGLGIDMQRLILAFGQVKAANFLRGTETRQFTEAGINLLGELAKYYSELEGRAVSLGEVQERQFKRMIKFQDVEEVFKRLTSAGGMFYDMQAKQAETLAGMRSNLQDSIDIMLNDIGKQNDGLIKNLILLIKTMVDNWKTVAAVMSPILMGLISFKTLTFLIGNNSKSIVSIWKNIAIAIKAVTTNTYAATAAQEGFNAATKSNAWTIILSLIVTALVAVTNAISNAGEAQREFNKIASDGINESQFLVRNYRQLADVVSSTTASYEEKNEALKEINRTYGEILPQQYLQAESIRQLKGNYDEATSAIYNYIEAKTKEKQLQKIEEKYGDDRIDKEEELAKAIQRRLESQYKLNISLSESKNIVSKLREDFEKGLLSKDAPNKINEILSSYFNQDISLDLSVKRGVLMKYSSNYAKELVGLWDNMRKEIEDISNQSATIFGDRITRTLTKKKDAFREQVAEVSKLFDILAKQGDVGKEGVLITQEDVDKAKDRLVEIGETWGFEVEKIKKLTGGAFDIKEMSTNFIKKGWEYFMNQLKFDKYAKREYASAMKFVEGIQKEIDALDPTPLQQFTNELIMTAATANGVSLNGLIDVFAGASETLPEYAERLKNELERLREDIADYEISPLLMFRWSKDDYNEAKGKLSVITSVLLGLGRGEKTKPTGGDKTSEIFKNRIKLITDANKEYEKYLEYMDEEAAKQQVLRKYSQTAKRLGVSDIIGKQQFDEQGTIDSLERLKGMYKNLTSEMQSELAESIGGIEFEMYVGVSDEAIDNITNTFESAMSGYELSMEFEKEGVPKDIAASLFGIDDTSLNDVRKKVEKAWIDFANMKETALADKEGRTPQLFTNLADAINSLGTKEKKAFDKMQEDITKKQKEELNARLKDYMEYYKNVMGERASLIVDMQDEIAKIPVEIEVQGLKDEAIDGIVKKYRDKLSKLDWEEFQNSDMYSALFNDLEYISTQSIETIRTNINKLKLSLNDLSPEQLKVITDKMNQLDDELIKRQPFKELAKLRKELDEIGKSQAELDAERITLYDKRSSIASDVADYETILGLKREGLTLDENVALKNAENAKLMEVNIGVLESMLALKKQSLKQTDEEIANNSENISKYEKMRKAVGGSIGAINEAFGHIKESYTAVMDALDAIGVDADSTGAIFADMGMSLSEVAVQAFTLYIQLQLMEQQAKILGVVMNSALGVIGWVAMAIQAVAMGITAAFRAKDNKLEKQIERQLELVENLQRAYDDLKESMDNAISMSDLRRNNEEIISNLEAQNEALRKSIQLEEDKKKTDKDKIKEWNNEIIDNQKAIEEAREEYINAVGGFGTEANRKSAAQDFVDTWLDAYLEVGDGLSALEGKMNDFLKDAMSKQLLTRLSDKYLKQIFNEFDTLFADTSEGGAIATTEELKRWIELYKESAAGFNEQATAIMEALKNAGIDISQGAGDTMSGLQKGISSITEDTAQVVASLLESVRYFTSDSNTQLRNLNLIFTNPPAENPLFAELKAQTEYMRLMYSLLNSMSMAKSGVSGRVIKVEIV